jgi:hypothetical protein
VLQPFGQRRLRPFLASFHQLPHIRRYVFKYLWVNCQKHEVS